MALCCIAVMWLAREIAKLIGERWRYCDLIVLVLTGSLLAPSVLAVQKTKAADVHAYIQALSRPGTGEKAPMPQPDSVPKNNDEWVALANDNIVAGGDVWPVFRRFYARND